MAGTLIVTVSDFPAATNTFWNPFNSWAARVIFESDLEEYNCTTSLPSAFPVLLTVTETAIVSSTVYDFLSVLALSKAKVVYDNPYPKG
ncbi:hypothetical protein D3C80_1754110 [compost metagenome]